MTAFSLGDNLLRGSTYAWKYNPARFKDGGDGRQLHLPIAGALVHITTGARNSRTGRNERAECGTSVWPEPFPTTTSHRLCPKCASKSRWRP